MTRNHSFTAALLAAIVTAVFGLILPACSKEQVQEAESIQPSQSGKDAVTPAEGDTPPSEESEGRQVILRVGLEETTGDSQTLLEEEESKISISKNDNGTLHTSWTGTDQLRVGRDANSEEKVFTIQAGYTDHVAEFSGTELGEGENFYVIYPSNISWNYIFSKDYNGVKQVGNDNTDHVDYCVMLSGMTQMPTSLLLTDRYAGREGLTLYKSSVIKFYLKLPAEAAVPTRIELKAGKVGGAAGSDYIFYANNNADSRTNTLTLYLEDVTPDNQAITAYLSIPWYGYSVAAGQALTISAYYNTEGGEHKVVSKTITPGKGDFGGGQTILYQVNMTKGSTTALNTDGDGTADNPYILSTVDDLLAMKGKLLNGETVYFEMDSDIDMASIPNWAPLNNNQQINFNRYIHFDGKGHLLKNLRCSGEAYASFFGVLCGTCRNTGFTDARIEGVNNCAGIVSAYLGKATPVNSAETGRIEHCYTTGYVTSAGSGVGGLVGQMGALYESTSSTISNCYSAARVEGNTCGGLTGFLKEGAAIEGSYFCGVTVSPDPLWTGGIAARAESYTYSTQPSVSRCASLTKTSVAPRTESGSVIYRIVFSNGVSQTGNLIWEGTTGNARNSSDTQAATTLEAIQTLFTTTLGSANGWSSTLDGGYPLLTWQVTRGDYATCAGHGQTYFDGGDGSAESPYLLSQPYQLYNMEPYMKTWAAEGDSTYFRLAGNIDLAVIDNWTPINQSDSDKRINLDGNGRTLSNLSLTNASSYAGLFGVFKGKVSNLTLKDFSVTQSTGYSGGILAGFLANTGSAKARLKDVTIDGGCITMSGSSAIGSLGGFCGEIYASGCTSSATVIQRSKSNTGQAYACGGLVGGTRHATGTAVFEDCSFSGSLDGYDNCGGILGVTAGAAGPRISACTFSGRITACARAASGSVNALNGESAGGIVGYHSQGCITGCSTTATSSVSGAGNNIGGIVGYLNHTTGPYLFSGCNHYGSVTGVSNVGGIIGRFRSTVGSQISDCHAYAATDKSISASNSYCGGIVGHFWSQSAPASGYTFSNCSSSATVQTTGGTGNYAGGIVGYVSEDSGGTNHSVLSLYQCSSSGIISSGNNSCGGLIGGMRGKKFSMTNCSSSATVSATSNYAGGLVAYLSGQYTAGDAEDILLSDCTFSGTVNAGTARAGGLIGEAHQCPGSMVRCRTVNPQGSTVHVSATRWAGGLMGNTTESTTLSLSDCSAQGSVTISEEDAGGLIGYVQAPLIVSQSHSSAVVQGRFNAGGLVGRSDAFLTLTACSHTTGAVRYDSSYGSYANDNLCSIGGLVGRLAGGGSINQCFVRDCDITGTDAIGGLVGCFKPYDSSTPTLTISESYYHGGTIRAEGTGNTRAAGGILGRSFENSSSYTTVIEDCYSRGTITASGGQVAGGIVGEAMKGIIVSYCISDCSIEIQRCAGGIIGRACNGGWNFGNDGKVKVENCICWSPSVRGMVTNDGSASSGAIIGITSKFNYLYQCYYNPDMTFKGVNVKNTLVEQNPGGGYNTSIAGSTEAMVPGTTPGTWTDDTYKYVVPYHGGTVQSSDCSACTVAQSIGFASRTNASSQYVWKIFYGGVYSADHLMPELRNNRETQAEENGEAINDFPTNDIINDGGNF